MRWWDVEQLLPLERDLFGDTAWTAEAFWSELAHPDSRCYLVAEGDPDGDGPGGGDLLGYAGVMFSGSEADVQTVAVAPSAQGRGVGALLLRELIDQAARRGVTSVLLEVRADNDVAIALYRRSGFERIGVRRRYYQPGDVDALVMRLRPVPGTGAGRQP
jgi:ribosomal-protein-alanine N-acetyltransferase